MNQFKFILKFLTIFFVILLIGSITYYFLEQSENILSVDEQLVPQLQNPLLYKRLDSLGIKYTSPDHNENEKVGINDLTTSSEEMINRNEVSGLEELINGYPAHIIGVLGWEMKTSILGDSIQGYIVKVEPTASIVFWSNNFRPINFRSVRDSVITRDDHEYVRRATPDNAHAHSILMTRTQNFDENTYLYMVRIRAEITDTTYYHFKNVDGQSRFECVLIVYYSLKTQPHFIANLIVLVIIFIVLLLVYSKGWIVNKKFHKYFLGAVLVMIIVFTGFLLPNIIQRPIPEMRFIVNVLRLLPDNALFFIAGLYLLTGKAKIKTKWFVLLVMIHVLTYGWEMKYTIPILFKYESMLFVPDQVLRELPPQIFGGIAFVIIGIGIIKRIKDRLETLKIINPPEMYIWISVVIASVFIIYGILQVFYPIIENRVFFTIALIAKAVSFSGILLFSNMYLVLGKLNQQSLFADTIIDASPQAMIVFRDSGMIERVSKTTNMLLKITDGQTGHMKDILADDAELKYLLQLTTTKLEKEGFLLNFKDAEGKKLDCLVSYVPIKENNCHMITFRLLDRAVLDEVADSIHSHSIKGKAIAALNFLDQLLKPIKEVYGFKEIENDEKFIKMKQHLNYIVNSLKDKESFYKDRHGRANITTLNKVIERIKEAEKCGEFDNIYITYDPLFLNGTIYVRHDEEILYQDIKELLSNSDYKFKQKGERGDVKISCFSPNDSELVKIVIQDSGDPIQEDSDKFKKFRNSLPSFLHTPRRGLESTKSSMNMFGGDLTAVNMEMNGTKIPTFTLILWKTKEK
ncbi:MAG: sensor histidine kinase [Ignavibacteriae bacterium]|nr:sensor histidine kinase [Ignavibacteriota bacterium]